MHELALAKEVLKKVNDEAAQKGIDRVYYTKVAIGETLISDPEEFKELFVAASTGTAAQVMKFELEIIPLKAECADCAKEFDPKYKRFNCSACGSMNIHIISGREIIIKELY